MVTDTAFAGTATVAGRRRWLTLALVPGGTFLATFDNFAVNAAIPTLQRDLGASFAQVQFVVAVDALAYAVSLVTGERLGDLYGRRRPSMLGQNCFTDAPLRRQVRSPPAAFPDAAQPRVQYGFTASCAGLRWADCGAPTRDLPYTNHDRHPTNSPRVVVQSANGQVHLMDARRSPIALTDGAT